MFDTVSLQEQDVDDIKLTPLEEECLDRQLRSYGWLNVMGTLDGDPVRAAERAVQRDKLLSARLEYKCNTLNLNNFAIDQPADDFEGWDQALRAKCPVPAISFENLVMLDVWTPTEEQHQDPIEALKGLHSLITPLFCSLNKKVHQLDWCLKQLGKSVV